MADLNVANNPVASPTQPVYQQPNIVPAPEPVPKPVPEQPNYEQPNPMDVPAPEPVPEPPIYEQPNPMDVPAPPAYEQPNLAPVPEPPVNALSSAQSSTTSENLNKDNDPKFKEKTEKFENLIMDLHERYMNLPEKIGKICT